MQAKDLKPEVRSLWTEDDLNPRFKAIDPFLGAAGFIGWLESYLKLPASILIARCDLPGFFRNQLSTLKPVRGSTDKANGRAARNYAEGTLAVADAVVPEYAGQADASKLADAAPLIVMDDFPSKRCITEAGLVDACSTCARKGKQACAGRTVQMDRLDALVTEALVEKLLSGDQVLSTLAARRAERAAAVDGRLASLEREAETAEEKLKRLYKLIEDGVAEVDDLSLVTRRSICGRGPSAPT